MSKAQSLITSWLQGRAQLDKNGHVTFLPPPSHAPLEKLRTAYDWISQNAIYCPYHDISFGGSTALGREGQRVELPGGQSYASFLLLPILTLMTSRTLLFIGAPGRGKTSMATLMALLSGYSLAEVRRAIQHGHPQLTIADLLGSPLPGGLVKAETTEQIKVSWRKWLRMRVKIIDEYNRIPTKTQSALLSLMADGYAEMYEQTIESGQSAWFLTANDDLGGGTFPVIEALKDRIDLVVRCTPFNSSYLEELEQRIQQSTSPFLPEDLLITPEDLAQIDAEVRRIPISFDTNELLGFFTSQLDFCRRASTQLEYMNKDTLHLSGRKLGHVCTEDCPLDKQENICTQTENGVSTRAYQSLLHYAKALAYFRKKDMVTIEDVEVLLPWVLHERLKPNPHSAFFQKAENQLYPVDRVSWIRQMFEKTVHQYAAYKQIREDCLAFKKEFESSYERPSGRTIHQRMAALQRQMELLIEKHELNGPVYEDLLFLKMLYSRYQRMLQEC